MGTNHPGGGPDLNRRAPMSPWIKEDPLKKYISNREIINMINKRSKKDKEFIIKNL